MLFMRPLLNRFSPVEIPQKLWYIRRKQEELGPVSVRKGGQPMSISDTIALNMLVIAAVSLGLMIRAKK